jgi:hypothetical protein
MRDDRFFATVEGSTQKRRPTSIAELEALDAEKTVTTIEYIGEPRSPIVPHLHTFSVIDGKLFVTTRVEVSVHTGAAPLSDTLLEVAESLVYIKDEEYGFQIEHNIAGLVVRVKGVRNPVAAVKAVLEALEA